MKIRELLSDESKWIKGTYAKTLSGKITSPDGKDAVCWCLTGAVRACYGFCPEATEILYFIMNNLHTINVMNVPEWNDSPTTTFSGIRALVEKLDI